MLILARHGQTEWNTVQRLQGWQNSPLTELGKRQAKAVAKRIAALTQGKEVELHSSPLGRALDTAIIVASELNLSDEDIKQEPLLKEYSYGIWEGLTLAEVRANYPDQWRLRNEDKWSYVIPDGESYGLMAERAKAWLEKLPEEATIVAVSHQMIGRVIRGLYLGLDKPDILSLSQDNDEIALLDGGRERIVRA